MLTAALDLLVVVTVIAAIVAAVRLGPVTLRWSSSTHPTLTTHFLIALFVMLVIAALAAPHLFPGCTFPAMGRVRAIC